MEFKYGEMELYPSTEIIAIGDIHGEDKKLEDILLQVSPILDNNSNCHIVFCGDICNRGPNSARVFEILIDLKKKYSNQTFFIMGNHEEMFIKTLQGNSTWLSLTSNTWDSMQSHWRVPLLSISDLVRECLNRGVIDFIDGLIPYYESGRYICTHAPLDRTICYAYGLKNYELDFSKRVTPEYLLDKMLYDLRWNFTTEDPKLSIIPEIKKFHICGHQFKHHSQPRIFKHRAFIDVGCGAKKDKPLVAVKFPEKKIYRSFLKPLLST